MSGDRLRERWPSTLRGVASRFRAFAVLVALAAPLATVAPATAEEEEVQVRTGKPTIIGGSSSTAGAWPWAVIVNERRSGGGLSTCTGTLIDSRWVLTAAHCFTEEQDNGYVEVDTITRGGGDQIAFESVHKHPGFDTEGFDPPRLADDVALVYLGGSAPGTIPFVDLVQDETQHDRIAGAGASTTILGWGYTERSGPVSDDLQEAVIEVLPAFQVNCPNGGTNLGTRLTEYYFDAATQVCAAPSDRRRQICDGDSGGPMMAEEGGTWYQVGIASQSLLSLTGENCEGPSVHMKVAAYTSWITATRNAEVWIDSPSAAEGATGTPGTLAFTVSLTTVSPGDVAVDWEVTGGDATAGTDYQAVTSGTVTIPAGATTTMIDIPLVGDSAIEPHKTVEVTLQDSNGARIRAASSTGTGTILNDDFPVATVDSPSIDEGASGTTASLEFTVRLSEAPLPGQDVELRYQVVTDSSTATIDGNGNRSPGEDFNDPTNYFALIFRSTDTGPNALEKKFTVEVYGDDEVEEDETVVVANTLATNVVGTATTTGTILDDDTFELSINSPEKKEGKSGTEGISFTVSLSATSSMEVTVDWAVTGGTATSTGADADYQATAGGTLTIPAGATLNRFELLINSDENIEEDETIEVTLSNPMGATFPGDAATITGTATILDDDTPLLFVSGPVEVSEGDGGATSSLVFEMRVTTPSSSAIVFDYALTGDATAGVDYRAPAVMGRLTLPPNERSVLFEVTVIGDDEVEPDETVVITYSNAVGGILEGGVEALSATGTILNDDLPVLTVDSPSVVEGDGGTRPLVFKVSASATSSRTMAFFWSVTGGTAVRDTDYSVAGGTLRINPGGTSTQITTIQVQGDEDIEPDETVVVTFGPVNNATFAGGATTTMATGTIVNDDRPELFVDAPTEVLEGDSGATSSLTFTVSLSATSHDAVTVGYGLTGSATAGTDYQGAVTGTVGIPAGASSAPVEVEVVGDDEVELDETVALTLSNPMGASLRAGGETATSTILNDDVLTFTLNSPSVMEGASGTMSMLRFTVTPDVELSSAAELTWTTTASGTATAGVDFEAASGTVAFAAGDTSATFDVTVIGDDIYESDEVMEVEVLAAGTTTPVAGRGTIRNDEPLPRITFDSPSEQEGDAGSKPFLFFRATMDPVSDRLVELEYETTDSGSATDGTDFESFDSVAEGEPLTFDPGDRTALLAIVINGDGEVEDNETVTLHILEVIGEARLATSTFTMAEPGDMLASGTRLLATGTIIDDEPRVSLSAHPQSVLEGAAGESPMVDLRFTMTRTHGSIVTVTYDLATNHPRTTAQVNNSNTDSLGDTYWKLDEDIYWAGGDVDIPVGSREVTVPLTIRGDDRMEEDETAVFHITGVSLGVGIGTATATVTIRDDEFPMASINSPSVVEGDSGTTELAFEVTLGATSSVPVTVEWEVSGSSTAEAGDYTLPSDRMLTIPAGATTTTITATVNGDLEVERDETVVIDLVSVTGGNVRLGTPRRGTGTIRNNDFPELTVATSSVAEGNDPMATTDLPFTLSLDKPSYEDVTVVYMLAGTADDGTDYETPTPANPLTIPEGSQEVTVTVPVKGDTDVEPDETVRLTLSNLGGGAARFPDMAAILVATSTIVNDDIPTFSITDPMVDEGDSGTATLTFTVSLNPAATSGVPTVDWEVTGGSAASGTAAAADYTGSAYRGTLMFQPPYASQTIDFTVNGDELSEPNDTVVIDLSDPTGGAVIGKRRGTGTIRNDDNITLSVMAPTDVDEGASGSTTPLAFTVELSSAATGTVRARYRVSGSAANAVDLASQPAGPDILTFAPGDTSRTLPFTVRGDGTAEPNETVTVTLVDGSLTLDNVPVGPGDAVTFGATSSSVTIRNDDFPELTVASSSVVEGDDGDTRALEFTLTLRPADYEDAMVAYAVTDGTTMANDYGPVPASPLRIPAGDTTATLRIPVTGDGNVEPDETLTLELTGITGAGAARFAGGASTLEATGRIVNDDIPTFSIDDPMPVDEGSSTSTPSARFAFTVSLAPTSTGPVSVRWTLSGDSTATAGEDYTGLTTGMSEVLTFNAGETSKPLPEITVVGDDEAEANETVVIELSVPTGGAAIGDGVGRGTIWNDDSLTVSVDSPSVNEGDSGTTELVFTMELSASTTRDVTFRYEVTASGTAESGADYRPRGPGTLRIPAGETTVTLAVPVVTDDEWEPDETVVVVIEDPLLGGVAAPNDLVIGTSPGTGTILNDDLPRLSIDSPEAAEGMGPLTFTVSLQAATSGEVTVEYDLGGDAAHGKDYTGATSGTLTIMANATTTTLEVPLVDDGIGEPHETVTVTLRDPSGAALREGSSRGTGTIRNDDLPPLTMIAPVSVLEGDAGENPRLVFAVEREDIGLREEFEYAYEVSASGTALQDIDFATTSHELVFPAGSLRESIEVTVFGDDAYEDDETVVLWLVNPSGDRLAVATGTIVNDDEEDLPTVTIDADAAGAVEPAVGAVSTTLTFDVELSATSSSVVTVDWAVTGGTATAGEDFTEGSAAGTVRFAPGDALETVEVRVLGDTEPEPEETVVVTLSNASGTEIWRGEATGVIHDGDPVLRLAGAPEAYESATGTLSFEVRLASTSMEEVSFEWEVLADGSTASADDLVGGAATGTGMIPPGALSTTIDLRVLNDDLDEGEETLVIGLASASGAEILPDGATAAGTIVDDDGGVFSVALDAPPAAVTEGDAGEERFLVFTVRLSAPASASLTVPYVIVEDEGTARKDGIDYEHASTTVVIPQGATSAVIRIAVKGDDYGEPEDTVVIRLGTPTAADGAEVTVRATKETATGVIRDNDADVESRRTVSVSLGEERGDGLASFVVNVLPALGSELTFSYQVEGGTLAAPPRGLARNFRANLLVPANERGAEFLIRPNAGAREVTFTVLEIPGGVMARINPNEKSITRAVSGGDAAARARALGHVLAGIGRTVATNIVDLVWDRAENHRSGVGGSHATVGGRRIDTRAFADDGDGALLRAAVGLAGDLLGIDADSEALLRDAERRLARGEGLGDLRDWVDLPDARDLAGRTDFALSFANGEGLAPYTFWGRGSFTAFESKLSGDGFSDFSADGEVFAGHLGLDYRFREDLLAGVAVSRTMGDVDYGFDDAGEGRGGVDTELTGLHPYLHWMSPEGLGVWGTLGYGTGSAELDDGNGKVETDLAMEMMAFGVRDELDHMGRITLAVKGDAFMAGVSADEVAGRLDAVDSDVSRVRAAIEGSGDRVLPDGALLAGRFELGARLDGGDAEEGFGADIAAGFEWTAPDLGLEVRGRGSMLLVHEESDFREWGLGLGVVWDPGVAGRGVSFSLDPVWGTPASTAATGMWNAEPGAAGSRASPRGAALNARLGYGMGVLDDRALMTVFGELGRSDGDNRLRLGAGFRPDAGGHGLALELYGERRDRAAGPDDSLVLKGRLGF